MDHQEMLIQSLATAEMKGNKKRVSGIRQILNTEKIKKNWGIVNASLDDPRSPPLTSIIRKECDDKVRSNIPEQMQH